MFRTIKKNIEALKTYRSCYKNSVSLAFALFFSFLSERYVTFITNKNVKFRGRINSLDYLMIKETYIDRCYYRPGFEIKENDTIIDIGAQIGSFSIYAAQEAPRGIIYAYEPESDNFLLLSHNVRINNCNNVKIYKRAVGLKGKGYLNCSTNVAGHSLSNILNPSRKTEIVECVSLQNIFESHDIHRCNFLKIDAEGCEYDILLNLPDNFFARIDKIVFEYHLFSDEAKQRLRELEDLLVRLHFSFDKEKYDDLKGVLFCKRDEHVKR